MRRVRAKGLPASRRLAFALALTSAVAACRALAPPNVILVSIDTLRRDHVGVYGYARPTTPALDAFAREAVVFADAVAQAPSTLPSHASLLTSLLPQHHGASVANGRALAPETLTLAEVLAAHRWHTASFNGGVQLAPGWGIEQGFEVYRSARASGDGAETLVGPEIRFAAVVDQAVGWLETRPPGPFFLFLHTYEVHHPYTPDPDTLRIFDADYDGPLPAAIGVDLLRDVNEGRRTLSPRDVAHIVACYDAEIRDVDAAFATLVARLKTMNLWADTLVVVTSDHGEEFGEHGWIGWHSHTLYEELLRVPLIIKFPRSAHAGTSVRGQVREIDVAPTLLAALGLPVPPAFEGTNLLPEIGRGSAIARAAVSMRDEKGPAALEAIRLPPWKWVGGRLFDLSVDPGETHDVAAAHPDIVASLTTALDRAVASRVVSPGVAAAPSAEVQDQLRALGYIR